MSLAPKSLLWVEEGLSSTWLDASATSSWLYRLLGRCSGQCWCLVGSLKLSDFTMLLPVPSPGKFAKPALPFWDLYDPCVFNCGPLDRLNVVDERPGTVLWFRTTLATPLSVIYPAATSSRACWFYVKVINGIWLGSIYTNRKPMIQNQIKQHHQIPTPVSVFDIITKHRKNLTCDSARVPATWYPLGSLDPLTDPPCAFRAALCLM